MVKSRPAILCKEFSCFCVTYSVNDLIACGDIRNKAKEIRCGIEKGLKFNRILDL